MKTSVLIMLMFLAAPLVEAARIIGFKPFSLNRDSQVKATPATSYPLVEERAPAKVFVELKEPFGRRADLTDLEEHPGSDANLKPFVFVKWNASDQRSDGHVEELVPSLKFEVVQHDVQKTISPFKPLGHSPGIGHDDPPGSRH